MDNIKGDIMAKCIYNNNNSNITVYDDYFTIGEKTINYSDVFAIRKDNLTNYLSLFSKNLYVFLFLLVNLIFFFIFNEFSTVFILSSNIVFTLVVLYVRNIRFPKMFTDELFVLYDIVYKTHHDTLIVSYSDDVVFNKKKLAKLTYMESRFLHKYLNRLKQARKYLFTQIESNTSAGEILYEKYSTVAQLRYKDTCAFDKKTLTHLEKVVNENFVGIRRYTLYMFRFNLIAIISAILHFVTTWEHYFI